MEATQKLEATQVLDFSSALDDEEAQEGIIVGRLVVEGVTHLVRCGVTKLGRDPTADIHVAQRTVSNCHVVIEADEDGATIHDRHSANGTKYKGKRLKPNIRHHLEHQSSLLFGNVEALWLEGPPGSRSGHSNDGNLSDNLLDEKEEEENRPPTFIPETPVVGRAMPATEKIKARPATSANGAISATCATDLSFVPESQSSPLPGSVLRHLENRVAESPASGLDDSSFLAPSHQVVPQAWRRPVDRPTSSHLALPSSDVDRNAEVAAASSSSLSEAEKEEIAALSASCIEDAEEDDMFAIATCEEVGQGEVTSIEVEQESVMKEAQVKLRSFFKEFRVASGFLEAYDKEEFATYLCKKNKGEPITEAELDFFYSTMEKENCLITVEESIYII